MKTTLPLLLKKFKNGEKLTMVTAYDSSFARLIDAAGIDMILVGDSMGMVMQGHANTLPVTLEEILYHTRCVTRVTEQALVVADMPFMSYQASHEQALQNAGRCLKEGFANAVKMEGGIALAETVERLTQAGIPVMGHIGLCPQQINQLGSYKVQGKTPAQADRLLEEAQVLEEAGCFALVLEGVAMETASEITHSIDIPTIGIGSGPACAGQVQVMHDLLGLIPDFQPKHAKRYLSLHQAVTQAMRQFASEVREGAFPAEENATRRILQSVRSDQSSK